MLNTVITFQNQTGSHLILLCISQNIQAQMINRKIRFLTFSLELANKYNRGQIPAHAKADITIHRFCPEDNIEK